jgi:hypothetical protein
VATAVAIPVSLLGVLLITQPSYMFGAAGASLSGLGIGIGLLQPFFSASAKVRTVCCTL